MYRRAFSLVELLAVIAIIALLSAIIFPVFARARDSANRSGDISAMNEIRSALQLYREDNGAYPPALLGYATRYASGPQAGQIVPAEQLTGFLFPKRVVSINTFRSTINRAKSNTTTNAFWPPQDGRALGSAPIVDLNGDGRLDAADDVLGARQAYGVTDTVLRRPGLPQSAANPPAEYYAISGYDVATVKTGASNQTRTEVRYALFWSNFSIGQGAGFGSGSSFDDPRQLGYSDPPENTVVTWNSFYRDYVASGPNLIPQATKRDIVLFLGGNAKMFDSRTMHERSWRTLP